MCGTQLKKIVNKTTKELNRFYLYVDTVVSCKWLRKLCIWFIFKLFVGSFKQFIYCYLLIYYTNFPVSFETLSADGITACK